MNTHQQQLLQQLRIKPYQLHADFVIYSAPNADLPCTSEVSTADQMKNAAFDHERQRTIEPIAATVVSPETVPPMLTFESPALQQLKQDIMLVLQSELPMVDWQPSAQNTGCHWQGHILQTPEIQAFCSSAQKKQLWLEFIKAQEQVDGSPHSSSHPG
jgi:hypothetical protein